MEVRETQIMKRKSCLNTRFKNLFHLLSVPRCQVIMGTFSFPNDSHNADKVIRDENAKCSVLCSQSLLFWDKETLLFSNLKMPRRHKTF